MPKNVPLSRLAPGGGDKVGLGSANTDLGMMATVAATKLWTVTDYCPHLPEANADCFFLGEHRTRGHLWESLQSTSDSSNIQQVSTAAGTPCTSQPMDID